MARFKYSGVAITGGTGRLNSSLGGNVLLSNGVVRNYVTPANPQTPDQMEARGAFAFYSSAWKGLTQGQRDAWVAAWQSGQWQKQDPFTGTSRAYGSAKDLFIGLNYNFQIADASAPDVNLLTPPTKEDLSTVTLGAVAADASAGTITVAYTGSLVGEVLLIRMTQPVSPGNERLTSVQSKLRTIKVSTASTPIAVGTEYVAKFGAITGSAGAKIFYTVEIIKAATGQRSVVGSGSAVIAA